MGPKREVRQVRNELRERLERHPIPSGDWDKKPEDERLESREVSEVDKAFAKGVQAVDLFESFIGTRHRRESWVKGSRDDFHSIRPSNIYPHESGLAFAVHLHDNGNGRGRREMYVVAGLNAEVAAGKEGILSRINVLPIAVLKKFTGKMYRPDGLPYESDRRQSHFESKVAEVIDFVLEQTKIEAGDRLLSDQSADTSRQETGVLT